MVIRVMRPTLSHFPPPIRTAGHEAEYLTEWGGIANRELRPPEVLFTTPRFPARRTFPIRRLNFKTYYGSRDVPERICQRGSAVGTGALVVHGIPTNKRTTRQHTVLRDMQFPRVDHFRWVFWYFPPPVNL